MNAHPVHESLHVDLRARPSEDGSDRSRRADDADRRRSRPDDLLELSAEARHRLRAERDRRNDGDRVRLELVTRLRNELARGEYDVDARLGTAVNRMLRDVAPKDTPA